MEYGGPGYGMERKRGRLTNLVWIQPEAVGERSDEELQANMCLAGLHPCR